MLRLMPTVLLAGTLMPAFMSIAARFLLSASNPAELTKHIQIFDFVMIGVVIFTWNLVVVVTLACVIVWLMKGPAYVADDYEVSHSDAPKP